MDSSFLVLLPPSHENRAGHLTHLFIVVYVVILSHVSLKHAKEYVLGIGVVSFREGYQWKSTWELKNTLLFKAFFFKGNFKKNWATRPNVVWNWI